MRRDLRPRKTKTASGATAVQVVRYEGKRRTVVKHIGSARDEDALAVLLSEAEHYIPSHDAQPSLFNASHVPKILKGMAANGSPAPLFETDDDRLACVVRLPVHPLAKRPDGKVTDQVTDQATDQVSAEIARLLAAAAQGEHSRNALQEALGLKHTPHFRQAFLLPALEAGLIEMTLPDKPRSSKQRYRLTPPQGQRWLDTHPDGTR